jgi:hypothetical protein
MIALGAVLLLPITGAMFRAIREWMFRRVPMLTRIPGVRVLYGDEMQTALRTFVGVVFIGAGILVLTSVLDIP